MRKWARLMIICIVCFVICVFLSMFLNKVNFIYVGAVFIAIAWAIKLIFMVCPHCGYRGVSPQWSKNKTYYCVQCGKPIDYGDSE